MISTLSGKEGPCLGWINHELIGSGRLQEHINAFGGEDRFWLGPEGGQYSIFFKPGVPFNFENWYVPPELDTNTFEVVEKNETMVRFKKVMRLVNYSKFVFNLRVEREIKLMNRQQVSKMLGISIEDLDFVAFESINSITNIGKAAWTKETGMLSIWILGMFQSSPSTTIVIPFKGGDNSLSDPKVNDKYFGKIPENRLKIEDGVLFFLADGKSRGKLGISPERAMPFLGSYDEKSNVLTIVSFSMDPAKMDYVNSMWEIQKEPFKGDAVNAYNDGPLEDGSQMGPFFELESSSPAVRLEPGSMLTHIHSTVHLTGDKSTMDRIVQKVFGTSLAEIYAAF